MAQALSSAYADGASVQDLPVDVGHEDNDAAYYSHCPKLERALQCV